MDRKTEYKPNQKHLTLSNRILIEQELSQGNSFKGIATILRKDPTTIAKEVKNNSYSPPLNKHFRSCKGCMNYLSCKETYVCSIKNCHHICRMCVMQTVTQICLYYTPYSLFCHKPDKPPYTCNGCGSHNLCDREQVFYSAKRAQESYEKKLVKSRQGINLTPEELKTLDDLISPLVLRGQPLSHIFAVHADEIPVSRRTLYNYFEQNVFKARNLDLPRRVRYKKRKKKVPSSTNPPKHYDQIYRNKRTYVDFERFIEAHPETGIVEMDTVKGGRAAGKCLLTMLFRSCNFMIVILLPRCTQACVTKAINDLTETIGLSLFRKYFPVILTDNGSEFKNPWAIEKTEDGKHRTYVFYCDPYVSNQKARLEKNHEFIRMIIPKERSMQRYNQDDINLMASHINSTARDSLNGATPFDLANLLIDKRIPILTGQFKVSPDDVMLKPELINSSSIKNRH